MKPVLAVRATLLSVAISLTLVGCGSDNEEMSQEDIQYLSHLDQSRFFQRQGELKASTLEARSAIEMQPGRIEPYLLIINNLLTAGDARNAERQLDELLSNVGDESISQQNLNDAALIRAEARFMQQKYDPALAALDELKEPDRAQQLEAALIRGDIHLAAGRPDKAEKAYTAARDINSSAARPLIGLSKVAYSRNNPEQGDDYIAQAEELDPDYVDLWLWKAELAYARGDWPAAEEAYINALETIGHYDVMTYQKFETMSSLIDVLREQGKSSEAFVYEEILAKSGPGMVRSNLLAAQEAYSRGDLSAAGRYLEEILRQAPGHEQSNLLLGMVRFRQGRIEEAEKLLAPIVESTESETASKLLAATRLRMRDPEGAKSILEQIDKGESDPSTLALAGIAALSSGDLAAGEALIEKSLEQNPSNHELRLRYARYLIEVDKHDQAISNARQVVQAAPELEKARVLLIQAHVASGDTKSAITAADTWLSEQPKNLAAMITRGKLATQVQNNEKAADYYEKAREAHPDSPIPLVAQANLALATNDEDRAKELFREALQLDPDNRPAMIGFNRASSRDETITLMNKLRDNHPDAVGPKLLLLEVALKEGNNSETDTLTASLLERENEDTPSANEPAVINIYEGVASQLRETNPERAESILNRARALFPESERIALLAADLAFQSKKTNEARDIVQEIKRLNPDSASPYLVEATHYERQGEYQQAAELYEIALTKNTNVNIQRAYIKALQRAGQTDKAIQAVESALASHPSEQSLLLGSAMLYQETNATEKAQSAYEALLALNPGNVVALNNLAWLYHESGDSRALDLAKKAYEMQPENGAVADTYGWILLKAGKTEESVPVLEKAHELHPDSDEIAMHLAEAYKASGRTQEAKAILERIGNQS